jgi:hypothetical protein
VRQPERTDTFTLQPGLALAIAPNSVIGLTLTVQHQWQRRDDRVNTVDDSRVALAAVVDFDLKPVGVMFAYRAQIGVTPDARNLHDLEVGLYYTDRDPLSLGIVAHAHWFDIFPGQSAASVVGNLVARYYWN